MRSPRADDHRERHPLEPTEVLHHDVEDLGGQVAEEGPEVVVVVGKHGADGVVHLFRARRGAIRDREAKGASVVAGAWRI